MSERNVLDAAVGVFSTTVAPPVPPPRAVCQYAATASAATTTTAEDVCTAASPTFVSASTSAAGAAAVRPDEPPTAPQGEDADGAASQGDNPTDSDDGTQSSAASWEVDHFVWPAICTELCRSEAFFSDHIGEKLRTAAERGVTVLAIASARRAEGCSTLALCLARRAAAAGVRTVLMDADFDHPELAAFLGVEPPESWPAVIRRGLPLGEAAVRSVEDRLTLLPLAPGDRNVPLSPDDSLVAGAVRQAASMFELVIVDVGSICEPTGRLLKRSGECLADAAIVVRDVRRTDQEQAMAAAARFHAAGLEAVAIVENFGTGEETAG